MGQPATIRTSIAPEAITKVTRLFNGTITDVLHELLQNARRAGASTIAITSLDIGSHPVLSVSDDGHGIADPSVLVSLGRSGWGDGTRVREDPAGMGVFSLAGHRVEIRSCPRGAASGWRIIIPDHAWETSAEIAVEPYPITSGTEILIDMPVQWDADLLPAATTVARFCPLPVTLNGDRLPCEDFLKNAVHVEFWGGCRIGVYHGRNGNGPKNPRINFHGVTLHTGLPYRKEIGRGEEWSVRVDIINAPDLQLVLPARKEMVANQALEALRIACLTAIYRAIADLPEHRLSYADHGEARSLGVVMPEAVAWLHGWKPSNNTDTGREIGPPVSPGEMIIVPDHDADIEQCAAPVFTNIALIGGAPVREEEAFEGYDWYDRLPRVHDLHFQVELAGATHRYCPDPLPDDLPSGFVGEITLHVEIATSARGDGTLETRIFPLSVLVCDNCAWCLDDSPVFIAEGADIKPAKLASLIEECLFCPNDDSDGDSWETQRREFQNEARDLANRMLLGEGEATFEALRLQLLDKVAWLVPQGKRLTATILDRDVTMTLVDAPAA